MQKPESLFPAAFDHEGKQVADYPGHPLVVQNEKVFISGIRYSVVRKCSVNSKNGSWHVIDKDTKKDIFCASKKSACFTHKLLEERAAFGSLSFSLAKSMLQAKRGCQLSNDDCFALLKLKQLDACKFAAMVNALDANYREFIINQLR